MKKKKLWLFILIWVFITIPTACFAESITNINGVVISEEEYNNFLKIHTHDYIMTMSEEKYEKLKSLDYENVIKDTHYFETTYNSHLNLATDKEITEEEYNNYVYGVSTLLDDKVAHANTNVRKLLMSVTGGSTWNYVTLTADWLGIPSTRSYDVIGLYGIGLSVRNGSQEGEQIYITNGTYKVIDYAWNGARITKYDNGFGFAMNIVNDNITLLQLTAECDVKQTGNNPSLFGSYQHATSNVSLENALNFELGYSGLGGVFIFPYSTAQKYDGLTGAMIQY